MTRPNFSDPKRPGLGETDKRLQGGFTEPGTNIGEEADLQAIRELQDHAKNESQSIRKYLEDRLTENDNELSIEEITDFLEALDKRSFSQGKSQEENASAIDNLEQLTPVFGRVLTINVGIANHDPSLSYKIGDFVKELDEVYICIADIVPVEFNSIYWIHIKKHDTTKAYSLDEYVIADGYVFQAIVPTVTAGYFNWGDWQKITNAEDTYTIVAIQRFKDDDGWSNDFSELYENVREMNGRDSSVFLGDRVNLFKAIDNFAGKSSWLFNAASTNKSSSSYQFAEITAVSPGSVDVYDNTKEEYAIGDYVLNSSVFVCKTTITEAEEFTLAKWTEILAFDSSIAYVTGEHVLYDGIIYKAPGNIPPGEWDVNDWTSIVVYRTTHTAKELIRQNGDWADGTKTFQKIIEVKGLTATIGDRITLLKSTDDYVFSIFKPTASVSAGSQFAWIKIDQSYSSPNYHAYVASIIVSPDDPTVLFEDVLVVAHQQNPLIADNNLDDTVWWAKKDERPDGSSLPTPTPTPEDADIASSIYYISPGMSF